FTPASTAHVSGRLLTRCRLQRRPHLRPARVRLTRTALTSDCLRDGPKELRRTVSVQHSIGNCQNSVVEALVIAVDLDSVQAQKHERGEKRGALVSVDKGVVARDVEHVCRSHVEKIADEPCTAE